MDVTASGCPEVSQAQEDHFRCILRCPGWQTGHRAGHQCQMDKREDEQGEQAITGGS